MRNLKRALSLTLASVMLLGMMVVGSSAAGFPDVDAEDNVEAIEVLNAVEVILGYENGDFGPDDLVTRAQMAVIMAKLLNLDYQYYEATCPFTDVPTWARGYVGACYANGITSGYGPAIYGSDDGITPVQAASMMMRALGYFKYAEDYADGFETATVRQGSQIGIFKGVGSSATASMTRDQVAQMALNALQADMVTFTGTPGIEVNGVVVSYRAEYTPRTSTEAKYRAIEKRTSDVASDANHKGQYYIQLGEELYDGKLKLKDDTRDPFGRPSRTWEYNGKEIGTYMKEELVDETYTLAVSGKTIYDLLGGSVVTGANRYNFFIYMDGLEYADYPDGNKIFTLADINRNNNSDLAGTGRGVLTQVFVDDDKDEITISMINTYLAIADADYNEKRGLASFDVYHLSKVNKNLIRTSNVSTNLDVKGEDFANAADVKDGDPYLVTVAEGEIQTLAADEVITETAIQAFSTRSDNKYVEVDSVKYNFAKTLMYDTNTLANYTGNGSATNLKDIRYNVYLDAYDNAIGVKEVEAVKNYVFITGVDANYSFLSATNYKANAIFLDGTMETITIDARKSEDLTKYLADGTPSVSVKPSYQINHDNLEATVNTWCTYTKNASGVYTLKLVNYGSIANKLGQYHDAGTSNDLIDSRNYGLYGATSGDYATVYANNDTTFLTASIREFVTESGANKDIVIDDVDGVATGIDNVKIDVWDSTKAKTLAADHVSGDAHRNEQSYGSYVLYNDKGYIIAAVVVGDDGGTNAEYVYVHKSGVEERDLEGDKRQWTRSVLIDGEEVTLTEINDSGIGDIDDMDQYKWYRVTFKGDGTVKDVESFTNYAGTTPVGSESSLIGAPSWVMGDNNISNWGSLPSGNAATTNVENISKLIVKGAQGDDVVVYHERLTNAKPELNNAMTLHVKSGSASNDGVRINENVKVWFREFVNNSESWDDGEGVSYLKSVIADLKQNTSGSYNYDIAALIENGKATTVIIRDQVNNYTKPEDEGDVIELDSDASVAQVNEELTKHSKVIIRGANWIPKTSESTNRLVEIPQGKTLEIKGDFDAVRDGVQVHLKGNADKGTLIVGGEYNMNVIVSGTINYDIQAGSMRIAEESTDQTRNRSVVITSKVDIAGDLTIQDSTYDKGGDYNYDDTTKWRPELVISKTGNVSVGNNVKAIRWSGSSHPNPADDVVLTKVDGTLTVKGTNVGGGYYVTSKNSLHALGGTVKDALVLNGGLAKITGTEKGAYSKNASDVLIVPQTGAAPKLMEITAGMTYRVVDSKEDVVTEKVAITDKTATGEGYDANADSDKVFGNAPTTAAKATGSINGVEVSGTVKELVERANAVTSGTSEITLNDDETMSETLAIKANVNLDLNGHTLTNSGGSVIQVGGKTNNTQHKPTVNVSNGSLVASGEDNLAVYLLHGANLTVENVELKANTQVILLGGNTSSALSGYSGNASLELIGCTLRGGAACIQTNGSDAGGTHTIILDDCDLSRTGEGSGMYLPGKSNVTLKNGTTVEGYQGITIKAGSLTVDESSTIKATGAKTTPTAQNTNGAPDTGAAIAIMDQEAYQGPVTVTVASKASLVTKDAAGETTKAPLVWQLVWSSENISTVSIGGTTMEKKDNAEAGFEYKDFTARSESGSTGEGA